MDKNMTENLNC